MAQQNVNTKTQQNVIAAECTQAEVHKLNLRRSESKMNLKKNVEYLRNGDVFCWCGDKYCGGL